MPDRIPDALATSDAIAALGRFGGVKRRMEVRGTVGGVTVIDDFAHHPSAIATTIDGLRARLAPGERILAVIEPRSNTMKLGAMKALLPGSLAGAERTYCYAGGLGWDAAEALAPLGDKAAVFTAIDRLVAAVAAKGAASAPAHVAGAPLQRGVAIGAQVLCGVLQGSAQDGIAGGAAVKVAGAAGVPVSARGGLLRGRRRGRGGLQRRDEAGRAGS